MNERFLGFPNGVDLLERVARFDKAEFADNKPQWTETILEPARCLVETLGPMLQSTISSTLQAVPKVNGSLAPITRDLRFATDRNRPYKDHLLVNFWDGSIKRHSATIRLRISADTIGFAAGSAFSSKGLIQWRSALADEQGQQLLSSIAALDQHRELRWSEPELKNPPRGSDPQSDEIARLLRHKTFQVRFLEPTPHAVSEPQFAQWAADHLGELADIHRWLRDHAQ